jgi:hypothetical protein
MITVNVIAGERGATIPLDLAKQKRPQEQLRSWGFTFSLVGCRGSFLFAHLALDLRERVLIHAEM